MLRIAEKLLRRRLFEHFPFRHEENARAYLARKTHLVRDDDHGHTLVRHLLDEVEHFAHHLRVERGSRLVKEHDFGTHGKGADYGDALFLSAGERGRIGVRFAVKPYAPEQAHGVLFRRGAHFSGACRRKLDRLHLVRRHGMRQSALFLFQLRRDLQLLFREFRIVTYDALPCHFLNGLGLLPLRNNGFKRRFECFNLVLEHNALFLYPCVVPRAEAREPLVVKGRDEVVRLRFPEVRNADLHGREGDVLLHRKVVEQVELLEHHAHFPAVLVDVDFEVRKVHAFEEYLP